MVQLSCPASFEKGSVDLPFVEHQHVKSFAESRVDLRRDDVKEFREQVNRLRKRLESHIATHPDFDLVKMLNSGSVAKGTALSTINDMDVAVYVKAADAPKEDPALVSWLEERLRDAYPELKPEQFEPQDHCVKISFRGTGLDVDVVPVLFEGDDDDMGCLITKDFGDRVLTSIPLHLEFIRVRKNAQPEHFARVVRLVKWWRRLQNQRQADFRFKSFMIELILAHLADGGLDASDYPDALERYFSYVVSSGLRNRIVFTDYYASSAVAIPAGAAIEIVDPVNPENNVAARYTEANRLLIVEAAHNALDALGEALYADTKGRAVACWQDVLGPSFQGA